MLNRPGFCGGCLVKEGHHLKPVWRLASSIVPQLLPGRLSGIQGLFQRIQNEIRLHGLADFPAHDAPGKYIDDESHIQPPLPSRYIIIGGGALLLRFNGSKWTQVFAEKYLGYAVSVGIKLFALYLIVGLGQNLANTWVTRLGSLHAGNSHTGWGRCPDIRGYGDHGSWYGRIDAQWFAQQCPLEIRLEPQQVLLPGGLVEFQRVEPNRATISRCFNPGWIVWGNPEIRLPEVRAEVAGSRSGLGIRSDFRPS